MISLAIDAPRCLGGRAGVMAIRIARAGFATR
jgi:hypothetical protein